jgi:protein-S-isoprenylcysteine O-methyltransferase Ste14
MGRGGRYVFKHLVSLILPITVLIVVPRFIEPQPVVASPLQFALGALLAAAGLFIMGKTIASFAVIGRGTLAPWNPPQHLVVQGMYAYVRNPMILGVMLVLLGEAAALSSRAILTWAVVFFLINTTYFILLEEPGLERRFGEEYVQYKRHVGRWIPRRTPWKGGSQ